MTPLLLLLLLCASGLVIGWGPGQHLEFAQSVYRRRREFLPVGVAKLLAEEKAAFDYGNIAADIINFKAYGGDYSLCHRWGIIDAMRELANSPRQEAFILGYLSHLAADTIAHNHFVPYHLARFARTKGLGHLYWEMNADRFVSPSHWKRITRLKSMSELDELDLLVNATVPKKALSMATNKLIFNHVLLVSERDVWRRGVDRIHPRGRVKLDKGFLRLFQRAAVDRIRFALKPRGFRKIQALDPNGKDALKHATQARQKIARKWRPGRMRQEEAERCSMPFLEGMSTPPRNTASITKRPASK